MPVFADIDPATYELDAAAAEAAVTPHTRAIIPVHVAGCSPDMDGILAVARRHGLRVVEDAALLMAQMSRLEGQMARRELAARFLDRELAAIPGIRPQARDPRVTAHAHHLYMLRYASAAFGGRPREQFLQALRAEGVPCSAGYTVPLHQSPAIIDAMQALYSRLGRPDDRMRQPLPVVERASREEGVWLSQSLLLAEQQDLQHIPEAIAKIQRAWG